MASQPPIPNPHFYVGQRLTDFTGLDVLVERVARGGYGEVAMGVDQTDGRWQAIKVLRSDLFTTLGNARDVSAQQEREARLRAGFLREALTWRGLWPHPNVLTAQFVTQINGQLMLVLDYAEQGSLRDLFLHAQRQGGWLAPTTALLLAQQIAAGLVALHTPRPDLLRDQPIVHRDLKPENILLSHGRAMITDFGLAKAVQEATTSQPLATLPLSHGAASPASLAALPDTNSAEGAGTAATMLSIEHALSAPNALASADPVARPAATGVSGPPAAPAMPTQAAAPTRATATQAYRPAYRTQQGIALGTPAYMAPEQWLDAAAADCPADAYAFGGLLVELFTGQHPLLSLTRPHSLDDWRLAHLADAPRTLSDLNFGNEWQAEAEQEGQPWTSAQAQAAAQASAALERLCNELLAKAPANRPTLAEALARLQAIAATVGQSPYTPPDNAYPPTAEHLRIFWQGWADDYDLFGLQEEALRRIERARAIAPDDPRVMCSQADMLAGVGRREEAVTLYQQALDRTAATDIQGRSITLNQLANRLKDLGRHAEAEAAYAEKLTLQPDSANAWYNRAINERDWAAAEARAERWAEVRAHAEQGLAYAERALALDPENPRRHHLVGEMRELRDAL